jgi:integrase
MRSQPRSKPDQPNRTVFQSVHGVVRIYTRRHINGCPLTSPDQQNCQCPKWLYQKPKGGKAKQTAAGTPSFTEACELAQRILKGFDPEIAQARARSIDREPVSPSVEDAVEQYLKGVRSRNVTAGYLRGLGSVFLRRNAHGNRNGKRDKNISLLDFLDRRSPGACHRMSEITIDLADDWAANWQANDLGARTWRYQARSFFRWGLDRGYLRRLPFGGRRKVKAGNRCGYFNQEQYAKLVGTLPFYRWRGMPEHYAERLGAFCDLGRWGGMGIVDIVNFDPADSVDAQSNILTYRRHKTRVVAAVLLPAEVAARLRAIPAEQGSLARQPLRFAGMTEETNKSLWRDRFQKLCFKAGITEIKTEVGTVRKPHPHMLRDTCAIHAIENGATSNEIAQMLGHTSSQMTEKSYVFWTQKRTAASIENQRATLARMKAALGHTDELVARDPVQDGGSRLPN